MSKFLEIGEIIELNMNPVEIVQPMVSNIQSIDKPNKNYVPFLFVGGIIVLGIYLLSKNKKNESTDLSHQS